MARTRHAAWLTAVIVALGLTLSGCGAASTGAAVDDEQDGQAAEVQADARGGDDASDDAPDGGGARNDDADEGADGADDAGRDDDADDGDDDSDD